MRLLLDTHALIWTLDDDPRLGRAARGLIAGEAEEVVVSAVTLWEIAVKHALGRMPMGAGHAHDVCLASGFRLLSLTPAHARLLPELPFRPDHRDPFDRMLLVQAMGEGLTLMTEDAKLAGYGLPTIGCA